ATRIGRGDFALSVLDVRANLLLPGGGLFLARWPLRSRRRTTTAYDPGDDVEQCGADDRHKSWVEADLMAKLSFPDSDRVGVNDGLGHHDLLVRRAGESHLAAQWQFIEITRLMDSSCVERVSRQTRLRLT